MPERLLDKEFLIFDCQATESRPDKGDILELAWLRFHAADPLEAYQSRIVSTLIRLPDGQKIPRQVKRVTGLRDEDLANGTPLESAWLQLMTTVSEIRSRHPGPCPTIIHFARYEGPYLQHLHQRFAADQPFPFDILCTYKMALRLVPQLPRKSLRAVAGYFGYSVPEKRRGWHHIAATAEIWKNGLRLLETDSIQTLDEYREWECSRAKPHKVKKAFPISDEKRKNLPDRPGIYRMRRSNGDLLYIGKATSLKKRVNSYFYNKKKRGGAKLNMEMLSQTFDIETTETGSALEAALLESDEIKKHAPPYNIALRTNDRETAFFGFVPLPSPIQFSPFISLKGFLEKKNPSHTDTMSLYKSIWESDDPYAPNFASFEAGLSLFLEKYRSEISLLLPGKSHLNWMMHLSKILYKKRLEQKEAEKARESEQADEAEMEEQIKTEWAWTAEAVKSALESIIRRGGHDIRRGRWYSILSESAITFISGETSGRQQRFLTIENGKVSTDFPALSDSDLNMLPGTPEGGNKKPSERKVNFDIMTYDRMRVLTGELRRLISDKSDRDLLICLGKGIYLDRSNLEKLFSWI